MLSLCRLAERQGLFKGDLNHVQRLGLHAVIQDERRQAEDDKVEAFKTSAIASNMREAGKIIEMFDQVERGAGAVQKFEPPKMGPLTADDKQFMLQELRAFGIST